jgi:HK97 family phage major capsid protein
MLLDGARRSIEVTAFPERAGFDADRQRELAEQTLLKLERGDEDNDGAAGAFARYMLAVGSPSYRRAFGKFAMSSPAPAMFSPQESLAVEQARQVAERAFTLGSTGLPVPYQLDPTIIPISNGSVNPYRTISRVVQTTVNEWRGATSAGITAAYAAEGTEASDNTPTLTQPVIPAVRAQAFVPFSIEVGQDWGSIEAEMTREVGDAKDDLEATKFTLGTGTNEPTGLIVGASTTVATATTGAFVIGDLYKLEEALPPRFRSRASIVANRFIYNKVRQFDTAGGSGVWLEGLQPGLANQVPTPGAIGQRVLGYPAFEVSAMDAVLTTGSEIMVAGDFRYFIIVDRVGMSADLIPHLVGTNHRPTGQRGLYFFWRNGAEVVNAAAFRTLQT